MKRQELKSLLLETIEQKCLSLESMTLEQFAPILFEQYKDIRVDGCNLDKEEDMVYVEYGPDYISLGRQNILPEVKDELFMSHLRGVFYFDQEVTPGESRSEYEWCETPSKLPEFESTMGQNDLYIRFKSVKPKKVEIAYNAD